MREDDPRFLKLARAILDDAPIDWDMTKQDAVGEDEQALVDALRAVEKVVRFHDAHRPRTSVPPQGPSVPTPSRSGPEQSRSELPQSPSVPQPGRSAPEAAPGPREVARTPGEPDRPATPPAPSVQPTIPERWGHLEIRRKIGGGVFGEIFLAWENTLQREVALKLVRPGMELVAQKMGGVDAHVLHEGRNLARVRHPNVVTIHGAEELDGRVGVWMEYIRGRTLEDLLEEHGPFGAPEADLIGIELCRALSAVHHVGLLHRDIKASNVMRESGGRIVLMDFGAGIDPQQLRGDEARTPAGAPAYLAPEILRGEPATPRSDIYSLGVLLYHLVTGDYPVRGVTLEEFRGAHERGEAILLRDVRPDLAESFVQIVERAIAFDPEQRFATAGQLEQALATALGQQSGRELLEEHREPGRVPGAESTLPPAGTPASATASSWRSRRAAALLGIAAVALVAGIGVLSRITPWGGSSASSDRPRIVVLPFENLGDPNDEYFADGITEEITSRLSEIPQLGVIARTSAMQYKDASRTIQRIGEELNVDYVLEGSVRWQRDPEHADHVRVTPQLVRVADETHMWTERYDAVLADIFEVQSKIARQVATALNVTLLKPDRPARAASTGNLQAYDSFLRGKDYYGRALEEEDARIAVAMFERAVELDPQFAEAYAALSVARGWLGWQFGDEDQFPAAKSALDMARQLDPDLPEVHVADGYYQYYSNRDYPRALEQFEVVRERQPNNAEAIAVTGYIQRRQGKWEQALENLLRAFELDPRAGGLALSLGDTYLRLRRYAEAERYYDRAVALAPDVREAYRMKVELYLLWDGTTDRARQVIESASGRLHPLEFLTGGFADLHRSVFGDSLFDEFEGFVPVASERVGCYLARGVAARARRRPQLAAACFDSARVLLEAQARAHPDEYRGHSYLGYAYAGLGRKEDAVREGRRAVELLPVTQDAFSSPRVHQMLARILVLVDEHDAALDVLEYLLSIPSTISVPGLHVDPAWDPLRSRRRFQRLLGSVTL